MKSTKAGSLPRPTHSLTMGSIIKGIVGGGEKREKMD